MICETCEGEGFRRGCDPRNPGALVILPCLECNGSGIASCCDAAGSATPPDPEAMCFHCGAAQEFGRIRCLVCGRPLVFRVTYRDDSFPERDCDFCGKPYRGPAVYCCLKCAVADA